MTIRCFPHSDAIIGPSSMFPPPPHTFPSSAELVGDDHEVLIRIAQSTVVVPIDTVVVAQTV